MQSQCKEILAWLKKGNSLTALEAFAQFNSMRLAARIYDLKEAGHNIISVPVKIRGKRVSQYLLGSK